MHIWCYTPTRAKSLDFISVKILGEDRRLGLKAQTVGLFDSFLAELIVPGTFVVNEEHSVGCLSANDIYRAWSPHHGERSRRDRK